jgi:tRNA (guanine-N7-)-methyltransferase
VWPERIDVALDWSRWFPGIGQVEVELGCGDGSFLTEHARRNPERGFIGVERLLGRLRKLERKAQRLGLPNVRGVQIEAGYFLQYLVPSGSLVAVHVYFPDPWPKRRHRRRRLVNEGFAAAARRALGAGGRVYVRTDDADYFAQMRRMFGADGGFEEVATDEELRAVKTDFERGFERRGVATLGAAFGRRGT